MTKLKSSLSVGEYAILGLLRERPMHGYEIARRFAADLDLGKSTDAFGVFVEAVGRRPKAEQVQLRADEGRRLDALERWTRRKSEPDAMDRKLAIVASLRAQLAAT